MDITPEYIAKEIEHADWLAIQAREAELRGDRERAKDLRRQYDQLFDKLEADLGYSGL